MLNDIETQEIPALAPHVKHWLIKQIEEDICKARVYLGLILYVSIVLVILLAGILACLILIFERLFVW